MSLQTKIKPKAVGRQLPSAREAGIWGGALRLYPVSRRAFIFFAFNLSFQCQQEIAMIAFWGLRLCLFCFSLFGFSGDHFLECFSPNSFENKTRGEI